MKKRYMAPAATMFMIQTSGMLALSLDGKNKVTNDNKDQFEVLTNKKDGPWGEEQNNSPWDNM